MDFSLWWPLWLQTMGSGMRRLQQWWLTHLVAPQKWGPPAPGAKPMSPALTGQFFTTEPPGEAQLLLFKANISWAGGHWNFAKLRVLTEIPPFFLNKHSWSLFTEFWRICLVNFSQCSRYLHGGEGFQKSLPHHCRGHPLGCFLHCFFTPVSQVSDSLFSQFQSDVKPIDFNINLTYRV